MRRCRTGRRLVIGACHTGAVRSVALPEKQIRLEGPEEHSMATGDHSRQFVLAGLFSAIEKSSAPVHIYVFPDGEVVALPIGVPTADSTSSDRNSLAPAILSQLLEVCPEALGKRIKPLLEAGWLTPKGYETLSRHYGLTTTQIVVFLLKYGGWITTDREPTMNDRIGDLLGVEPVTIKKHIHRVLSKIDHVGSRDTLQVHRWAISKGILVVNSSTKITRLMKDPP
jgi:hypothetical protein